jgi:hypothetical protein
MVGELVGGGVGGRVGGKVGDLVGGSATVCVGGVVGTWALELAKRRSKAVAVMVELVVVMLIEQSRQKAMCYRVEIMDNELCGGVSVGS